MATCCLMAHGGWVLVLVLVLVKEEEQVAEGLEAVFGSPRMDPGRDLRAGLAAWLDSDMELNPDLNGPDW